MTPLVKGLIVAAVHVALVASLGGKLLYDRVTRPRVWARTMPFDPDLPIRGRYVSLQLIVEARGVHVPKTGANSEAPQAVALQVENHRLIAEGLTEFVPFDSDNLYIRVIDQRGEKRALLAQPIAYFIPEHVTDPSVRAAGEELWVEVTIPQKGPPRPIQLGVKKGDGPIAPLNIF